MTAQEALRAIFEVVVAKAEKDQAFAREMIEAISTIPLVEVERPAKPKARKPKPAEMNPMQILRESGDIALRSELNRQDKAGIVMIANMAGITLPTALKGKKATKEALIQAVIEAAKFRLAERAAA